MFKNGLLLFGIFVFFLLARDVMGEIPVWVNFRSAAMVFTGTIVCGLLAFPVRTLWGFFSSFRKSMRSDGKSLADLIQQIVVLARLQRVAGLGEMNRKINAVSHPVLRRGFLMILDNHDRHRVETMLEKEINIYLDQLQTQLNVVNRFSRLAPVFGFVGTIIGLINVLNHIGDSTQIGQGMAAALLTTFYGLLFANFLFLPLAGKFAEYARREALALNVIFDGVLCVADGRPPLEIAHYLLSYAEADQTSSQANSLHLPKGWNPWGRSSLQRPAAR